MDILKLTLTPRSAFGSPLRGDTLFGQLCWAVVRRFGEARLTEWLEGYTAGRPFAVISDAFPTGFLPRPALPLHRYCTVPEADRKQVKKRRWLPREAFARPLGDWLEAALDDAGLVAHYGGDPRRQSLWARHVQPHNTLNRLTGTTGTGMFAPYGMPLGWYLPGMTLDVYVAFDGRRIDADTLKTLLDDIGRSGYGRDASIGLGRFDIGAVSPDPWPAQAESNAWMTLAPCAPQGLAWDVEASFWHPFTRFGRHGDIAVHRGRPFKTPVLLTDTGAVLKPAAFSSRCFVGQGLGGGGRLSNAIEATVHQGYAPVLAIRLEETA